MAIIPFLSNQIVTEKGRIYAATQFLNGVSSQNFYLFIGQTLQWPQENSPPVPIDCENDISSAFRNMMSAKLITSSNVILAVPRYDWTLNTVYTQYNSAVNLLDPNLPPFFVLTSNNSVYKCIGNNNGVASTIEPISTSTSVVTTSDGYQWKYLLTVNATNIANFLSSTWVPIQTLLSNDSSNQWLVQQAAVPGTIDRIDVTISGVQYTSVPTVNIVGDGSGAVATASISNGGVVLVTLTNNGQNYTYANITFTGGGVGATGAAAVVTISPFSGHGADPVSELGASAAIIAVKLIEDESGTFTVSNDYRQIAILCNPFLYGTSTPATGLDYDQTFRFNITGFVGTQFNDDEVVTGNTSGATGIVLDWNSPTLKVINVVGTFVSGETITGSVAHGTINTITTPDLATFTGNIFYLENLTSISRQPTQTENIKIYLPF